MATRYCSKSCTGKAYKAKKNQKKLQEYENAEASKPLPVIGMIGNKEFLTPTECALLLGVCRSTLYNMLASDRIPSLQLRRKTIIRRSDVEKVFDQAPSYQKRKSCRHEALPCYTTNEILEKFHIQKKTLYRRCKMHDIPKIERGNRVYYNRVLIDKYFADLAEDINTDLYYTPEEVMERYGMTRAAVITFAQRHNIPRINRHREVYYSRAHIDAIKEKQTDFNPDYYTYKEIGEKYGLSKINISYNVNKYNIDRFRQGSNTMVLRTEFDRVYKEHRDGTYQPKKREPKKRVPKNEVSFTIPEGYYSSEQIAVTYQMTKKTVCKLCRENSIPKVSHGGFNYYEKLAVERFFAKYQAKDNVKEWIGAEQMEQLYGMTKDARRSFAHRHDIPTRMVYGKVQYSRDHIDMVKNGGFDQRENYYSVTEAMEKYGLRRDVVYNYCKYNKVRKMHQGNSMFILKEDFDRIMLDKLG